MPESGENAPEFTLPRDGGGKISLSDFRGHPVVVYFYPRDDTPGCTTQSKDFTTAAAEFEAAGTTVLGISKDSVASHDKFRDKARDEFGQLKLAVEQSGTTPGQPGTGSDVTLSLIHI